MKAAVYSIEGKKVREREMPEVFETPFLPELIKRAVLSMQSAGMQPKGAFSRAGRETTAVYVGARHLPTFRRTINTGMARRPRSKEKRELLYGRVLGIAGVVGGIKAHAPNSGKILKEKINKKEKRKALNSAIGATARADLAKSRGHVFGEEIKLPLVVEAEIEKISKTKKAIETMKALHLWDDIQKAKQKKRVRSGKGKKRGRKYKRAKSVLVVAKEPKALYKAARNIEGVEVVGIRNLNAELLAPGTMAGRLTLWSEAALDELEKESKKEGKEK